MSDSKGDSHCVCIKDFNRLNYCQSKHRGEKFFCSFCLQCFTTQEILVNCDFNYKITNKIPVVFFNLRGYDCSFIMQEIGKFKDVEINFIPSNTENI